MDALATRTIVVRTNGADADAKAGGPGLPTLRPSSLAWRTPITRVRSRREKAGACFGNAHRTSSCRRSRKQAIQCAEAHRLKHW